MRSIGYDEIDQYITFSDVKKQFDIAPKTAKTRCGKIGVEIFEFRNDNYGTNPFCIDRRDLQSITTYYGNKGDRVTLDEIAEILNMSKESVSNMCKKLDITRVKKIAESGFPVNTVSPKDVQLMINFKRDTPRRGRGKQVNHKETTRQNVPKKLWEHREHQMYHRVSGYEHLNTFQKLKAV